MAETTEIDIPPPPWGAAGSALPKLSLSLEILAVTAYMQGLRNEFDDTWDSRGRS